MCMLLTSAEYFISKCARQLDQHIANYSSACTVLTVFQLILSLFGKGSLNDETYSDLFASLNAYNDTTFRQFKPG